LRSRKVPTSKIKTLLEVTYASLCIYDGINVIHDHEQLKTVFKNLLN